jgi:hypothetical protein
MYNQNNVYLELSGLSVKFTNCRLVTKVEESRGTNGATVTF